LRLA
jgi:tetratricopeptide (TPR) repeat protein